MPSDSGDPTLMLVKSTLLRQLRLLTQFLLTPRAVLIQDAKKLTTVCYRSKSLCLPLSQQHLLSTGGAFIKTELGPISNP
jgi:hypothetical protein